MNDVPSLFASFVLLRSLPFHGIHPQTPTPFLYLSLDSKPPRLRELISKCFMRHLTRKSFIRLQTKGRRKKKKKTYAVAVPIYSIPPFHPSSRFYRTNSFKSLGSSKDTFPSLPTAAT